MNSNEIIKVIDDLASKFGLALDWTNDNVMPMLIDLYERIVQYNIVANIIFIVVNIIFIVGSTLLFSMMLKSYKACLKTKNDNALWEMCFGVSPTALGVLIIIITAVSFVSNIILLPLNIGDLIGWVFLPELQILEYIKNIQV